MPEQVHPRLDREAMAAQHRRQRGAQHLTHERVPRAVGEHQPVMARRERPQMLCDRLGVRRGHRHLPVAPAGLGRAVARRSGRRTDQLPVDPHDALQHAQAAEIQPAQLARAESRAGGEQNQPAVTRRHLVGDGVYLRGRRDDQVFTGVRHHGQRQTSRRSGRDEAVAHRVGEHGSDDVHDALDRVRGEHVIGLVAPRVDRLA